uniref:Uncharacterized protein n=1 Tax=Ciona intestinalis TaxID=7719 RepID=H2XUK7_CIOIN
VLIPTTSSNSNAVELSHTGETAFISLENNKQINKSSNTIVWVCWVIKVVESVIKG